MILRHKSIPVVLYLLGMWVILNLSACAITDTPHEASPYAAAFESAYKHAENDFERRVLEDHVITDAEYAEAQQLYLDCLDSYGMSGTYNDQGQGEVHFPLGMAVEDGLDKISECSRGTRDTIGPLYHEIRMNPEGIDLNPEIVKCLIRHGVVDPDYIAEDFEDDLYSGDPSFDTTHESFDACAMDPLNTK